MSTAGQPPARVGPEHEPSARFVALYRSHYDAVYRYCLRRLAADRSEADDATAGVFEVAWRRIDAIPADDEARWWLLAVARHVVARAGRGRSRRARLAARARAEAEAGPDAGGGDAGLSPDTFDAVTDVRAAIDRLRPRDGEVLRLVLWDGLANTEAAVVLGCSPGAVAMRLQRARRRLQAELERGGTALRGPHGTRTREGSDG